MSNGKVNSTVTEDISIGSGDDGIDLNEKATLQQNQPVDEEKQRLMQEYREELTKVFNLVHHLAQFCCVFVISTYRKIDPRRH
jgi:hypothetical protein